MIWLNPERVTLGSVSLGNVDVVAIDRRARHVVMESTDMGPHVGFADVPSQKVEVRIVRRVVESEPLALKLGDEVLLAVRVAPNASAARVFKISATVVITAIEHDLPKSKGATQRITMVAVSSDGKIDPVTELSVEGEV